MCDIVELSLGRSHPSEHNLREIRKAIMNRIYRSIRNEKTGTFVATSENAKGNGNISSPGASALALNRVYWAQMLRASAAGCPRTAKCSC